MKFGYVICGVVCAGITLALSSAWAQNAQNKPKAPPAGKPAAAQAQGGKPAAPPPQSAPAKQPAAPAQAAPAPAPAQAAAPANAGGTLLTKAMMPGEHHRQLTDLRGTWNVAVKLTADPGATPVESTGTSVFAIIMDGRFVVENFVGTSPMGPFTGMGVYGYDTLTDQYENVWVDTMSTGMFKGTGSYDATSNELRWRGEMSSPKNGGKTNTKAVMKKVDATHYEYSLFEERGDKYFKSVELAYTKA